MNMNNWNRLIIMAVSLSPPKLQLDYVARLVMYLFISDTRISSFRQETCFNNCATRDLKNIKKYLNLRIRIRFSNTQY